MSKSGGVWSCAQHVESQWGVLSSEGTSGRLLLLTKSCDGAGTPFMAHRAMGEPLRQTAHQARGPSCRRNCEHHETIC